ncbi:MAG TPA: MbcA/ParS/Xre antitoxin family protein [Croceibacterium sp.]|nr:MbcA/ParS/Xre antitoxin family protein [Croceibacterium sp.]
MTEQPENPARNNPWRRRPKTTPIPRDQAVRQGDITSLAFLVLGRERAIEFLNTDHEGLGGRPLDLATASDEGRANVEAELGRMKYQQATTPLDAPSSDPDGPVTD